MGAVVGSGMNIGNEARRIDFDLGDYLGIEPVGKHPLHFGDPEDAALPRAGNCDADISALLRYEHAYDRVARRRIAKLRVGRASRDGEDHAQDDLVSFERRLKKASEETV